jgi:phage terminase large subunit
LLGIWTAAEGAVYPAFDRQTHVREVDCDGWPAVIGVDVGTRNPTAILTVRYSGDKRHIEHEVYERGMSSDAITDAIVSAYEAVSAEFAVVDPSAAGLILALEGRGPTVRKGVNDVKVGIAKVTSALTDLTVDPSCEHTINEFESYRYSDRARSESDTPVKEFDHALDSLRYVIQELDAPAPDWGLL